MSSTGTLVAGVVTTVTLASRVNNVTVTTDGPEIWFTTDGRNPDYQQDIAHRVPFGRSVTVPVTGQADPTVIKLRAKTGSPGYIVTAADPADSTTAAIDAAIAALVAAAPGALDTLNELAAALGDDANFAATVTTALAAKLTVAGHAAIDHAGLPGITSDLLVATTQANDYTLALADASTAVEMTKATATTLTVPPNADVAFPVGTVIEVFQAGAGQVTIAAGAGVTLRAAGAKLKLTGQYSGASLRKRATNEWVVAGDLSA